MDIKQNWKTLSLIGLLSLIEPYKYLSSSLSVFIVSVLINIAVAVVVYYFSYYFASEKSIEERRLFGLKNTLWITGFNTLFSFFW